MLNMKKIAKFFIGVKEEMKRVRFPSKKDMRIYGTATLAFIFIFALFFTGTDLLLAFLNSLGK